MLFTRRHFLRSSLGASALAAFTPAVPRFLCRAAEAAAAQDGRQDTILVVVQLAGGNDGLNTVVPYGDDGYGRNRSTLRLSPTRLHKIDTLLGFHPEMSGFDRLYKDGHLAIVQGVGYPDHSDQHPGAMRAWQTARPEDPRAESGWVGRAADIARRPDVPATPAVLVGQINRPFSINAQHTVIPAIQGLNDFRLQPAGGEGSAQHRRLGEAIGPSTARENRLLDFVIRSSAAAEATDRRIEAIQNLPAGTGDYPPFQFAGMLRSVAQLIRANSGIRIYYTELGGEEPGGFDNHAAQRDNHAALLRQLSDSVAAFFDDLKRQRLLDRVVLMTISEFGRSVAENGRHGTDHGSAAPMFVAGGQIRGGLIGPHPSLTHLEGGGLAFHTDFRRVYATLLDRWLGLDSQAVLATRFEPLALLL
jgi:uncharacterized protein (DUF1501 family)